MKLFRCTMVLVGGLVASSAAAAEPDAAAVFERRIMPIFKSPNPSSCTECHLAGVDLKHYILPSSEQTFLALRDQGLVDVKEPGRSKILKLISMRDSTKKPEAGAALVHETARRAEFEAFAEWIRACAADERLVTLPKLATPVAADPKAGPSRPVEVVRHARKDKLLESFENSIWAMRFRCMSCHIEGTKDNDKLRAEHGDQVAWIKQAGSQATMEYLLASKLIDWKSPEESLLLKKPLLAVEHKGGKKFLVGDQGYKAFRGWIEDVAKIRRDEYPTAESLPQPAEAARYGTDIWIKLNNTPAAWVDALVQVDIYRWDDLNERWGTTPILTTDRANFGKGRLWQHNLTVTIALQPGVILPKRDLTSDELAKEFAAAPSKRFLLKAYVDRSGKLGRDWTKPLDEADFAGQTEFEAKWKPGYGAMTVVDGMNLK